MAKRKAKRLVKVTIEALIEADSDDEYEKKKDELLTDLRNRDKVKKANVESEEDL